MYVRNSLGQYFQVEPEIGVRRQLVSRYGICAAGGASNMTKEDTTDDRVEYKGAPKRNRYNAIKDEVL